MKPINESVVSIIYNEEYPNLIHQVPNIKGITEHENYNNALYNLMAYDVYFGIYFPYDLDTLAKQGHLAVAIQNPGFINDYTDYLIFFPWTLTPFQISFLDAQEKYLKEAQEINFEIYNKPIETYYCFKPHSENNFSKYKEFLDIQKNEMLKRNRTPE